MGSILPPCWAPFGRKNHAPTGLRTTLRASVTRRPQIPEHCQEPAKNNHPLHRMTTAIADRIAEPSRRTRGRRSIAAGRPTINFERLSAGPRRFPRQVLAILGAERLPKGRPGGSKIESKRRLELQTFIFVYIRMILMIFEVPGFLFGCQDRDRLASDNLIAS